MSDDLTRTTDAAAAFGDELSRLREGISGATRDIGGLERGLSGGLRKAIDGLVLDGGRLSDALATLGRSMIDSVYSAALKPVTDGLGSLIARGLSGALGGLSANANGNVFSQGRIKPFAQGGVVSGPTTFPMRGGTGLMGEAGPEAIMPLARGADGRLGVRAQGGGAAHVTIHVTTPDVAGFRRSQGQIAAEMSRLLGRGARNR